MLGFLGYNNPMVGGGGTMKIKLKRRKERIADEWENNGERIVDEGFQNGHHGFFASVILHY